MSLAAEMDAVVARTTRENRDPIHLGPEYLDCSVCGKPDPSRCEHHLQPLTVARECALCGTEIAGPSEWCRACRKSDPFVQPKEYTP